MKHKTFTDTRCEYCRGWIDEDNNFHHSDDCPTMCLNMKISDMNTSQKLNVILYLLQEKIISGNY